MHGTRNEVVPSPPPFEIVLRGFHRNQVIDHVNALKTRVGTLGAERDTALQRAADLEDDVELLRREAAEATRQVERLRREAKAAATELDRLQRSPVAGASARIQRMLRMAEDEAAELQTSVEQETSSLRHSAQAEADQLRSSAQAEADQLLAETRQLCERLEAESTDRRETAEAESAGRRYLAEQQSEQDIAGRKAEMEAWASNYQASTIAALHALVQITGERLNSRMVKVNHQIDAAKALRSEVTGQLCALQRLLAEALGEVERPVAAEQAAEPPEPSGPQGPAEPPEPTESAEPAEPVRKKPVARAGRSGGGPGPARQMARPGGANWPQRADQPTARFGLHPY